MHNLISYLAVVFIYLAVATDFWRCAKIPASTKYLKLHTGMIAVGLVIHGWLLFQVIFDRGFNLGLFNVLSAISWLTVLIYWVADLKHQLTNLQAFVLPAAAIFVVLPASHLTDHILPAAESALFLAHIGIAILAYSLFTFATLHALLMAMAERNLHNKSTLIKLPSFPPLMVMETLLFRIIGLGFILLSITVLSGLFFSQQIFDKPMHFNHKTIFSIASWFIYGGLLFGRYQYGWRGIIAIRWTLAGFLLLLMAYVGSTFVLQIVLNR